MWEFSTEKFIMIKNFTFAVSEVESFDVVETGVADEWKMILTFKSGRTKVLYKGQHVDCVNLHRRIVKTMGV